MQNMTMKMYMIGRHLNINLPLPTTIFPQLISQLIEQVWGIDFYGTDRVVDVYVGQVRRKLLDATGETLIQTVRGVGYKFVAQKE